MGLFTMKDRIEALQRNARVAFNTMKYDLRYKQAVKNDEKCKKRRREESLGKTNILLELGYIGDEDAPALLSAYDIYDIINDSYATLNMADIKNVPVNGERYELSEEWDNTFKSLIRIIYTTLLYPDYDVDSVLDDEDIELWISMMKDPKAGRDVAAFDQQNPGNVSLYGLIKKTNDILYMSYPGYEDMYLEAEMKLHRENEENPGKEKRIMLVKLPIVISGNGDEKSSLMSKVLDSEELDKVRDKIISLVHDRYNSVLDQEEEDDDDFDEDDDDYDDVAI